MVRISSLLFLIVCIAPATIWGQSFQGDVIDAESREPIPYANIFFVELETGTTSNVEGHFVISHYPKKKIRIQVSCIGYETLQEVLDLAKLDHITFSLHPSHFDLQEVVVSVPLGRLQSDNVVGIERRDLKSLKNLAPMSLAETISQIPGVEQNSTGVGIGKPVIRGLSGNRIVTFAQGIRVENQQWGDEHGLGVGDVGIESVEVIKGPASLLYGSDALGGVLYFVDERYAEHNSIEGSLASRFNINTLGSSNDLGIKWHKERLKMNLFGNYGTYADYSIQNGNSVLNSRFDQQNVKSSLGYNYKHWISNLRYSYLKNNFGLSDTLAASDSRPRSPDLPFQRIDNHALAWENTLLTGGSRFNLILGYTGNHRSEFEESKETPILDMDLRTYTYNLKWYAPTFHDRIELILGSQGMDQENKNQGEELLIPDALTRDIGGFSAVRIEWEKIQIQGGIRLDSRRIETKDIRSEEDTIYAIARSFQSLNYSLGFVIPSDSWTIRSNISTGFRAPNTSELLSNGVHEGTNRFERGNAELRSEKATQIDLSIAYQSEHLGFNLDPFFNSIQNFIYLEPDGTFLQDVPVYDYVQRSAIYYGGEAGIHFHPHQVHGMHLESNFSMVMAQDEKKEGLPLIPGMKWTTSCKLEFSGKGKLRLQDAYITFIHRFEQDRTAAFENASASYDLVNIGLSLLIGDGPRPLELNTGVRNVLNENYIDHLSRYKVYGIQNQGRDIYFGLTWKFKQPIGIGHGHKEQSN